MQDIKLIGKVRIRFAHELSVSLEDKDVTGLVQAKKKDSGRFSFYMKLRKSLYKTTRDIYQAGVF